MLPPPEQTDWDPEKQSIPRGGFNTDRKADLSKPDEQDLDFALRNAGYFDPDKREQIRSSALDPAARSADGAKNWNTETVEVEPDKPAARYYALCTVVDKDGEAKGDKPPNSPYWVTEKEFSQLRQDGLIDLKEKRIDAGAIKERYALPCYNQVTGVIEAKATRDHSLVTTTCGPATETYTTADSDRPHQRQMQGGGTQCHPDLSCIEIASDKYQNLATIDGKAADWREGYELKRGLPAQPVNDQATSSERAMSQQQKPDRNESEQQVDKYMADKKELETYRAEHWKDTKGIAEREKAVESEHKAIEQNPEAAAKLKEAEQREKAQQEQDEQQAKQSQGPRHHH